MQFNPTFLCIPDLTGFTKFMTQTELRFSATVIPALLRTLVKSNVLEMKIAEIEGDAVLFYKKGVFPNLRQVFDQALAFQKNFYIQLDLIKSNHPGKAALYLPHGELGLKVVVHCGNISASVIGNRVKLIGEDMIKAHKLLKNSIEGHEYLLLSENYLSNFEEHEINLVFGNNLKKGRDHYEHIGTIPYRYASFQDLFKTVESGASQSENENEGNH